MLIILFEFFGILFKRKKFPNDERILKYITITN